MEEQGKKGLGRRIGAKLAGAGRSIWEDYQAGGVKKMARNKYFIILCGLFVLMAIGSMGEEKAGITSTSGSSVSSSSDYGDAPSDFLQSRVLTRNVQDYPEDFTVEKFIRNIAKFTYNDGTHPKLGKWKKSGNTYSIPFSNAMGKGYLVFEHDKSGRLSGNFSFFRMKTPDGKLCTEDEATSMVIGLKLYQ